MLGDGRERFSMTVTVVTDDVRDGPERTARPVDLVRWERLASLVGAHEGARGELTLTFVDEGEIASLNEEYMGKHGPTDVLSFPMDDEVLDGVPVLLGDVVVCPEVAATQAGEHAGNFEDEIALLIVHGILHVLGHDHAEPGETLVMRERELDLLQRFHWHGPTPDGFRQEQD